MKSKFKITIPIILLIIIVLGTTIPRPADASIIGSFLGDIGKDILKTLFHVIQYILNFLFKAGAAFFEGMLGIGFKDTVKTITIGWQACRDFANMFFILFMVVIAFGTILRIEKYGVKTLLPKIIGVALLINFSMVFCSIIIDFSNIAADFFISDVRGKISGDGAISATLADAFNVTGTYTALTCEQYRDSEVIKCSKFSLWFAIGNYKNAKCVENVMKKFAECQKSGSTINVETDNDANLLDVFLGYAIGSIIMLIAAFTLFAGGLMLLFRIIAIWFLVTISPLVFICYILPSLQDNWKKWWKTFISWCIFAPAYAFFIWMAVQIAVSGINKGWGMQAGEYTIPGTYGSLSNDFVRSPGEQLISFFIIIGFLVGGMIVAKNLGIYGANATMNMATSVKKSATGWMSRQAMRPVKTGGSMAGAGALGLTGRLFGGKIGGRMQAKAVQIKQARMQTAENKNFAELTKTMTDDNLIKEIESGIGPRKLIATQTAMSRGLLAKTNNRGAIKESVKTLKGYGFNKEAGDLANSRPDVSDDIKKTVASVLSKDEQGSWKETAFEPAEGKEIIKAMIEFCGNNVTLFREKFGKLNGLAKKKMIEQMRTMFTDDFTDDFANADNLMTRQRHAAITGSVYDSFKNSSGTVAGPAIAELEKFIRGMKPGDFTGLDPQSAAGIAPYIDTPTAKEILKYISVNVRRDLGANFNPTVKAELRLDDKWKLYIV